MFILTTVMSAPHKITLEEINMKKIVALVLSMVMALSLAAVAFGLDYIQGNNVWNIKADGSVIYGTSEAYAPVKYVDAVVNADGSGSVGYYVYADGAEGKNGWAIDSAHIFIPCEKEDATHAVNTNNSFTTYVRLSTDLNDIKYAGEAKVQGKTDAFASCNVDHFKVDGYLFNGSFYVKDADGNANLLVNGKVVKTVNVSSDSSKVVWASHVLLKGVKNAKTGWYEAKCAICGATFACTNDMMVLKNNAIKEADTFKYDTEAASLVITEQKAAGKYSLAVGTELADDYTWCWTLKAASTTDTTKPSVDSPKTFDADIAMYVGLSLLSVAGGAVVIGKKKEF